jgi:hypothetical protein
VVSWEEGLVAFASAVGELWAECDASHVHVDVVQQFFFTQEHASNSRSKQFINLGRTLEECQILLCLQEANLEVHEAILVAALERGLHSSDWQDMSAELDKAHALADGITDEHAVEAM